MEGGAIVSELTEERMAAVFAEWLRQYNEDPMAFEASYPTDTDDYGTACAQMFLRILGALRD